MRDIELPDGVALVHVDPDELVVKVAALRIVEEEAEVAPAEGETEAAAGEAAEAGEESAPE